MKNGMFAYMRGSSLIVPDGIVYAPKSKVPSIRNRVCGHYAYGKLVLLHGADPQRRQNSPLSAIRAPMELDRCFIMYSRDGYM